MRLVEPEIGDFALVRTSGFEGRIIRAGTDSWYNHALLYVGDGRAIQAQPHGAEICAVADWSHPQYRIAWSTGLINPTYEQRKAIAAWGTAQKGVPYGWLDIAALSAKTFHISVPYFNQVIENEKRLICSQLVDKAYELAGVHLFEDGRLTGDVTPGDLWNLLLDAGY